MKKMLFWVGFCLLSLSRQADSAGLLSNLFNSGADADFSGLNKWLTSSLPNVDHLEENVQQVKTNLDQMTDPKVKLAAEIFVELLETKECNHKLLMDARHMEKDKVGLARSRRIEQLLVPKLNEIKELCVDYIGDTIDRMIGDTGSLADQQMTQFLEEVVLQPNLWQAPVGGRIALSPPLKLWLYILDERDHSNDPADSQWIARLGKLARQDPQAAVTTDVKENHGRFHTIYRVDNFEYAYKKYLVEPCERITGDLGETFTGLYALMNVQRNSKQDLSTVSRDRSAVIQLLYANKVCQALLGLSQRKIQSIAKKARS